MMAAWMLYSAAVALLIALAARAGDVFLRAVRLPVRWVWLSGLLATVVLSGMALVRMQTSPAVAEQTGVVLPTPLADAPEPAVGSLARALDAIVGLARDAGVVTASTFDRVYAMTWSGSGGRVAGVLMITWGVCSAALLLLFAVTMMRVNRARGAWPDHRIGDVTVLISPAEGPALVGLLHPAIVVPRWLLAESPDRQRLVVEHEQEHLRAGDHALLGLACFIVCLLPWNPALWWMLRRTRLAVELDCDARVLRRGAKARSYGSLLLDIAGRTRARPFGAPAIADSRTHLERRIRAMTELTRTPRRARSVAAGAAALLLALAACAAEMPTAAEIDELDVAEVEQQAEKMGLLRTRDEGAPTVFYVDGVLVSEETARALTSDQIASIEVLKSEAARRAYGAEGANGVVRMRTRSAPSESGSELTFERRVPLTAADSAAAAREGGLVKLRAARIVPTQANAASPLIIVDGVIVESDPLKRLSPESIEKIEVRENAGSPLIIIDGVIVESAAMKRLIPESIESVEVLKGAAARAGYTDLRALNGVIRITTKAGARKR